MNSTHPENRSQRIHDLVDVFYPDGGKSESLISGNLPSNKELLTECIRTADALIASGKVGSTALAQILKVKVDSVITLSQSREQELICCLRQACALLSSVVAESGSNISPNTGQLVTRFILELDLLGSVKLL